MNCFVEFDTNAENFADIISASRDSVVNVTKYKQDILARGFKSDISRSVNNIVSVWVKNQSAIYTCNGV